MCDSNANSFDSSSCNKDGENTDCKQTSPQLSFTIPKIQRRKMDLLSEISTSSYEYQQDILPLIQKTFYYKTSAKSFTFNRIFIVHNSDIMKKFTTRRKSMKTLGYSDKELGEGYGFLKVNPSDVHEICQNGLKVGNSKTSVLGNPEMGVHISRHADILPPKPVSYHKGSLIMFKYIKGKVKTVAENLSGIHIDPSPNYDCHLSKTVLSETRNFLPQQLFDSSQIYLYEYVDCTLEDYPSQLLPYALVEFEFHDPRPPQIIIPSKSLPLPQGTSSSCVFSSPPSGQANDSKDEEFIIWNGQLGIKGTYLCRVALTSTASYFKPARLGTVINITNRSDISKAESRYLGQLTGVRKNEEGCWRGRYINICELRPKVENDSNFLKIVTYLKRKNSMAVIKPDLNTDLLLLPEGQLSQKMGISPVNQQQLNVIHCVFLSRQSARLKSPEYTARIYKKTGEVIGIPDYENRKHNSLSSPENGPCFSNVEQRHPIPGEICMQNKSSQSTHIPLSSFLRPNIFQVSSMASNSYNMFTSTSPSQKNTMDFDYDQGFTHNARTNLQVSKVLEDFQCQYMNNNVDSAMVMDNAKRRRIDPRLLKQGKIEVNQFNSLPGVGEFMSQRGSLNISEHSVAGNGFGLNIPAQKEIYEDSFEFPTGDANHYPLALQDHTNTGSNFTMNTEQPSPIKGIRSADDMKSFLNATVNREEKKFTQCLAQSHEMRVDIPLCKTERRGAENNTCERQLVDQDDFCSSNIPKHTSSTFTKLETSAQLPSSSSVELSHQKLSSSDHCKDASVCVLEKSSDEKTCLKKISETSQKNETSISASFSVSGDQDSISCHNNKNISSGKLKTDSSFTKDNKFCQCPSEVFTCSCAVKVNVKEFCDFDGPLLQARNSLSVDSHENEILQCKNVESKLSKANCNLFGKTHEDDVVHAIPTGLVHRISNTNTSNQRACETVNHCDSSNNTSSYISSKEHEDNVRSFAGYSNEFQAIPGKREDSLENTTIDKTDCSNIVQNHSVFDLSPPDKESDQSFLGKPGTKQLLSHPKDCPILNTFSYVDQTFPKADDHTSEEVIHFYNIQASPTKENKEEPQLKYDSKQSTNKDKTTCKSVPNSKGGKHLDFEKAKSTELPTSTQQLYESNTSESDKDSCSEWYVLDEVYSNTTSDVYDSGPDCHSKPIVKKESPARKRKQSSDGSTSDNIFEPSKINPVVSKTCNINSKSLNSALPKTSRKKKSSLNDTAPKESIQSEKLETKQDTSVMESLNESRKTGFKFPTKKSDMPKSEISKNPSLNLRKKDAEKCSKKRRSSSKAENSDSLKNDQMKSIKEHKRLKSSCKHVPSSSSEQQKSKTSSKANSSNLTLKNSLNEPCISTPKLTPEQIKLVKEINRKLFPRDKSSPKKTKETNFRIPKISPKKLDKIEQEPEKIVSSSECIIDENLKSEQNLADRLLQNSKMDLLQDEVKTQDIGSQGKTNTRSIENRKARQFHPYNSQQKVTKKKQWASFNLAISDLQELMQDMTSATYQGTPRMEFTHCPGRFLNYSFQRSVVPSMEDSEKVFAATPDDLEMFEEKRKFADMVEAQFTNERQLVTDEDLMFEEECEIYSASCQEETKNEVKKDIEEVATLELENMSEDGFDLDPIDYCVSLTSDTEDLTNNICPTVSSNKQAKGQTREKSNLNTQTKSVSKKMIETKGISNIKNNDEKAATSNKQAKGQAEIKSNLNTQTKSAFKKMIEAKGVSNSQNNDVKAAINITKNKCKSSSNSHAGTKFDTNILDDHAPNHDNKNCRLYNEQEKVCPTSCETKTEETSESRKHNFVGVSIDCSKETGKDSARYSKSGSIKEKEGTILETAKGISENVKLNMSCKKLPDMHIKNMNNISVKSTSSVDHQKTSKLKLIDPDKNQERTSKIQVNNLNVDKEKKLFSEGSNKHKFPSIVIEGKSSTISELTSINKNISKTPHKDSAKEGKHSEIPLDGKILSNVCEDNRKCKLQPNYHEERRQIPKIDTRNKNVIKPKGTLIRNESMKETEKIQDQNTDVGDIKPKYIDKPNLFHDIPISKDICNYTERNEYVHKRDEKNKDRAKSKGSPKNNQKEEHFYKTEEINTVPKDNVKSFDKNKNVHKDICEDTVSIKRLPKDIEIDKAILNHSEKVTTDQEIIPSASQSITEMHVHASQTKYRDPISICLRNQVIGNRRSSDLSGNKERKHHSSLKCDVKSSLCRSLPKSKRISQVQEEQLCLAFSKISPQKDIAQRLTNASVGKESVKNQNGESCLLIESLDRHPAQTKPSLTIPGVKEKTYDTDVVKNVRNTDPKIAKAKKLFTEASDNQKLPTMVFEDKHSAISELTSRNQNISKPPQHDGAKEETEIPKKTKDTNILKEGVHTSYVRSSGVSKPTVQSKSTIQNHQNMPTNVKQKVGDLNKYTVKDSRNKHKECRVWGGYGLHPKRKDYWNHTVYKIEFVPKNTIYEANPYLAGYHLTMFGQWAIDPRREMNVEFLHTELIKTEKKSTELQSGLSSSSKITENLKKTDYLLNDTENKTKILI